MARYAVKNLHGYISKKGTSGPRIVKTIEEARLYHRKGDAWAQARRWDKHYAPSTNAPFPIHSFVVEVYVSEGKALKDPKFKA